MFSFNQFENKFSSLDSLGWQLVRLVELFVKSTLLMGLVVILSSEQYSILLSVYFSLTFSAFLLIHNFQCPYKWYEKVISFVFNYFFFFYTKFLYFNFKESPLLFRTVETSNQY